MPDSSLHAFISYAREDADFALRLTTDLKQSGASVWLDQLDIRPGERWDGAVEEALSHAPRMLVVLSPAAIASNNVMDEVSYALEEHKVVIPVLYRDCAIPFRLRRLQFVDFRGNYADAQRRLLATLSLQPEAQRSKTAPATQHDLAVDVRPQRSHSAAVSRPIAMSRRTYLIGAGLASVTAVAGVWFGGRGSTSAAREPSVDSYRRTEFILKETLTGDLKEPNQSINTRLKAGAEEVRAIYGTASFYDAVQPRLVAGRLFQEHEMSKRSGSHNNVLLNDRFWTRVFDRADWAVDGVMILGNPEYSSYYFHSVGVVSVSLLGWEDAADMFFPTGADLDPQSRAGLF